MKLKSTKYILLTSMLGAATFYSCTDLDEQVFSEVLSSSYQPTEKDLPAIVAPVYSSLRGLMLGWQGYFDLQEESADAIITPVRPNGWDDGGTYRRMHQDCPAMATRKRMAELFQEHYHSQQGIVANSRW
jgi:hypothetical protein